MPVFMVEHVNHDTCGNSWSDDKNPIRYVSADHIQRAYTVLGHGLRIVEYRKDGVVVHNSRTPEGKGYGIWEPHPRFFDVSDLSGVDKLIVSNGFQTIQITQLPVEELM